MTVVFAAVVSPGFGHLGRWGSRLNVCTFRCAVHYWSKLLTKLGHALALVSWEMPDWKLWVWKPSAVGDSWPWLSTRRECKPQHLETGTGSTVPYMESTVSGSGRKSCKCCKGWTVMSGSKEEQRLWKGRSHGDLAEHRLQKSDGNQLLMGIMCTEETLQSERVKKCNHSPATLSWSPIWKQAIFCVWMVILKNKNIIL